MPIPRGAKIETVNTTIYRPQLWHANAAHAVPCIEVRADGKTIARFCGRTRRLRTWLYLRLVALRWQ